MTVCDTIYKIDSKGKTREWRMEVDGSRYRTVAGVQGGSQVISGWKEAHPKNVGRSNATTAEEQALLEVEAKYTKKLDGEYHETLESTSVAKFYKPMLATKWEDLKDKIDYPVYTQPKLDGVRCIVNAEGMWSRTGKAITSCPHIIEQLAPLFETRPDLVLDGELYNHDLKDDFNKIISLVRKTKPTEADTAEAAETVQYHMYDVPSLELDFHDRYVHSVELDALEMDQYAETDSLKVVKTLVAYNEQEVDEHFGEFIGEGYEGGMIRVNAPYEQKRSKTLMKRKDFEDMEFEIVSIEEGQGNWAGYAKRVVFKLEDGRECGSGLAGNQEYARKLLADRDQYVGGQVTVQYFTRTPDGVPRFPIAKALFANGRDV